SRIRAVFGVELPLRDVFESSKLAAMATQVRRLLGSASQQDTLAATGAIPRVDRKQAHAVSYGQQRLWFLHQLEPEASNYNVPICLRLRGQLDIPALDRALRALGQRHEALRTRLLSAEPLPLQWVDDSLELSLAHVEAHESLRHELASA